MQWFTEIVEIADREGESERVRRRKPTRENRWTTTAKFLQQF